MSSAHVDSGIFKVMPHVFNWIYVWGLTKPFQNSNLFQNGVQVIPLESWPSPAYCPVGTYSFVINADAWLTRTGSP